MARFALLVLAAILYGSLYPFDFRAAGGLGGALDHLLGAWPARSSLPDLLANVLLYMPFGAALAAIAAPRAGRIAAIVAAAAAASVVATAVELAQHFLPTRVVNPVDVLSNVAGSAIGALAGLVLARMPGRPALFAVDDRLAILLAAAWVADRLWPFVPTLDVQQIKDALKPLLLRPVIEPPEVLRHLACGYGFALLLRAGLPGLATRSRVLVAVLAVPCLAVFAQGRTLTASAALGAVLAAAFWLASAPREGRGPERILAALMATAVLAVGLAPYEFAGPPRAFGWLPFSAFVGGTLLAASAAFIAKSYLFGTLVWSLARSGLPPLAAGLGAACLLGAIGWAQTWLPGRSAGITDAVIALGFAAAVAFLREPAPTRDHGAQRR